VFGFSPPVVVDGVELLVEVAPLEALVVDPLLAPVDELVVELPEDPHPAASASAAQAISVVALLIIGSRTLA
jgi:hypothetical protein